MDKSRCIRCGNEILSGKILAAHGICDDCFEKMRPEEKTSVHPNWTLHHDESGNHTIDGHQLICPICGHNQLWKRKMVLITPAAAAWNFLWASKKAITYICDRCGYIFSFLREPTKP